MKRLIVAGILSALPAFASASPLDQFSNVFFFGDSLTDGGAAIDLASPQQKLIASVVYPKNQLTNGDSWATQLGGTYVEGTYTLSTGFTTTNFAFGGAEAIAEPDDDSPDLAAQIGVFSGYVDAGVNPGPNSLAFILIGANDIRDIDQVLPPPGAKPEQLAELLFNAAQAISVDIIAAITQGVSDLRNKGVSKVAVFGLPDLGLFPSVIADGLSEIASQFTPVYNTALRLALESQFTPEQAMFIDTAAIFDDILANAGSLGITKPLDVPCVVDFADIQTCLASNPNSYFFYDTVHPSETVHTAFASAVERQFLTPVPLPASAAFLLAALGGLFVLRRSSAAS